MIRDITLGQYYPGESPIHRLDARTKIIATILYIIELFVVNNFWWFLIAVAALFAVIAVSRVPVKFIFRGLTAVFIIIAFTFIINLFMVDGRVLWHWRFLTITYEGVSRAFFMAVRLVLLIIGSSMMTLTTKPIELTDGLEKGNAQGGNEDDSRPAPEFSFDLSTCPILFIHGDADGWAAMNSVKCWEQLRRMGIQGDLHTLATRKHCFQRAAAPGTGSYTWLDRIWEFMNGAKVLKD